MGIRDKPIALGSPWQNGYAERLIGTIRRECLDHVILFGEAHVRRLLGRYAVYYNESRIHRSLEKDAPSHRAMERFGVITSQPVLGGLHHQYCRIWFSARTGCGSASLHMDVFDRRVREGDASALLRLAGGHHGPYAPF